MGVAVGRSGVARSCCAPPLAVFVGVGGAVTVAVAGTPPTRTEVVSPAASSTVCPPPETATIPTSTQTVVFPFSSTSTVNNVPTTLTVAEGVLTSKRESGPWSSLTSCRVRPMI